MSDSERELVWGFALGVMAGMIISTLSGCMTKKEIMATVWKNNGLPVDLCGPSRAESPYPQLWDYGVYRRLNDSVCKENMQTVPCNEFVPYCKRGLDGKPLIALFFSVHYTDLNKMLDGYIPEE